VAAGGIGIEVDADEAVFLDALFQFGDAGLRIDAGRLRQHRRADEVVGEELRDAVAQLVADRRPGAELTLKSPMWWAMKLARGEKMVRSEPRSFIFFSWLALDRFAQFVVADLQLGNLGHRGRVLDAGDLAVAPLFQRLGRGGVVAVDVDDHGQAPMGRFHAV
jgi:hypothetical protein